MIIDAGLESESARYLFSLCCVSLGRYSEAETTLLPANEIDRVPKGAAGLHLLAKVYQLSNRQTAAIASFRNSLNTDPLMWCSFEELCMLGAEKECSQYLQMDPKKLPNYFVPHPIDGEAKITFMTPNVGAKDIESSKKLLTVSDHPTSQRDLTNSEIAENSSRSEVHCQLGDLSSSLDHEHETPEANIITNVPPPLKKGPKAFFPGHQERFGSPSLLGTHPYFSGRKFLDEGLMRKVR